MSLVARITALAQAVGADIKAISANVMDLAGTRQMTGPLDNKGQTETTFSGGKFDLNGLGDYYIASLNAGAQITSFGTVREGARRLVRFYSGILLTHSDTLVLPGAANITTQNDDIALFVSRGGGSWRTAFYSRADGTAIKAAAAPVTSVAGKTGAVVLAKTDVGLDQVDNTSDATKLAASLTQLQSYGVGMTQLQTTADVDAVSDTRFSRTTASTSANRPLGLNGALATMAYAASNIAQIYVTSTGRFAWRFTNNGVQGVWNEGQSVAGGVAQIQAFGLGGDTVNPLATDLNGALVSQLFRGGSSLANKPDNTSAVVGIHLPYSLTYNGQLAFGLTGTQAGKFFYRTQLNAVQGAWNEVQTVAGSLAQMQLYGMGGLAPPVADLDALAVGGKFTSPSGNTGNPSQIAVSYTVDSTVISNNTALQLASPQTAVAANRNRLFHRQKFGGTWMAWAEFADVDAPSFTTSLQCAGPVRVGQYTLTTLPSASAYNGYEIDVTNATVAPAGPKRCRSNGTNWIILNTTTIVS